MIPLRTTLTLACCLLAASCGAQANIAATTTTDSPAELTVAGGVQVSPNWGGGYARATKLSDGSLLGSVTGYRNGTNYLRVSKSTNMGQSFTDLGEISEGVGDIDNIQTAEIHYTAPGAAQPRILAAFRNHSKDARGNITVFRITVCRSDDGGKTWVFHSQVDSTQPPVGLWEPFVYTGPDGAVQVYYAKEYGANDQDIVMRRSSDGGLTWGNIITVAGANIASRDGMPGVTQYFDGSQQVLTAIFESGVYGLFQVMSVKSYDGGATWTQRAVVHAPRQGRNSGSPQIATVNGKLVAVFMNDEDAATPAWPNDATVKMVSSVSISPSGVVWSAPVLVAPAPSFWPGILTLSTTQVLFTYNHNNAGMAAIGTVAVTGEGAPATPAAGYQHLINPQSGMCLDISGGGTADGTLIQLWPCNNLDPQRFIQVSVAGGLVELHNKMANKCVDVSSVSQSPGAQVWEWTCLSTANQRMHIQDRGDGSSNIIFSHSGQCLDIAGGSTQAGARVQQYPCNGSGAQAWRLVAN